MPYTIQPVLLDSTGTSNLGQGSAGYHGWPSGPFNYFLLSHWICLGTLARTVGSGPNLTLYSVGSNLGSITVGLLTGLTAPMFNGIFDADLTNSWHHVLVSVNALTQTVQVYVNDTPVVQSSGAGWTVTGSFNIDPGLNFFAIGAGGAEGAGIADFYCTAPASFFDLSITANRRKFINADLTPVDLGANASSVLGTPPIDYLTVRPGGVATDFGINYGTGGAFPVVGPPLMFLAPGSCPMPVGPPPPPPPPLKLAMDNVVVTAQQTLLPRNLISLRWSDDRGHSWGHPVTIPMGEAGEYRTSLQWQRLAYSRDRVFELSWDAPCRTALQGAWIDVTPAQS